MKSGMKKILGKGTIYVKARGEKYVGKYEEMKDSHCGWSVKGRESDWR